MRAFGMLIFLAGIFVIFNSDTIRKLLQGQVRLNLVNLNQNSVRPTSTVGSSPDGSHGVGSSY